MKKLLLSLGLMSALSFNVEAQTLQVGDIAPDFTVTDINNNPHTLYDYLDEGYMVFIDISATWCGPCWSFSSSGIMKEVYEKYGPAGTITPKKIMVLFIEGDGSTTLADLQGTGPNTQGDWVTGKPYPIIDDASLNNKYLGTGFPSFTVICPNREVVFKQDGASSNMTQLSWFEGYMNQCITPIEGTNAALKMIHTPVTACAGQLTKLSVELLNFGTDVLSNAQITAKVGGVVVASKQWTGNLATFATETVEIGDVSLDDAQNMVTYEVIAANDAYVTDNILQRNIEVLKTNFRSWNIQTKTDNNPIQNAWSIKDENGSVVYSHAYTVNDASTTINTPVEMEENKCYTINLTDNGTDGITSGYIKILDGLGQEIYTVNGSYSSLSLQLKSGNKYAGINGIAGVDAINVYPNPAANNISVNIATNKDIKAVVSIIDMLGRNVNIQKDAVLNAGNNTISFDVNNLSKGIYFINIATEDGTMQAKFVKD